MSLIKASQISGSVASASYALTASYAANVPATASYALQALSSSYAITASYALNVPLTSSYAISSSFSISASYFQETDPIFTSISSSLATTGSNTFYGLQIISASYPDLSALDIHIENDIFWAFRIYNDTYSTTSIGLASWVGDDGTSFLGTETDQPLHIYNNANYYGPTLLISSSGVTINNTLTVNNGITGSLFGTASYYQETDPVFVAKSGSFATTGSNIFKGLQTIYGNLFMSGSFPLIYNNDSTNNMLFGMFDGSTIYGPYYQLFGNQYPNISQRGGAEFIYDIRNNSNANFHIASFNGSSWTQKFLVNDNGTQITGSLNVSNGITGSLLGTASYADSSLSSSYAFTASYLNTLNQDLIFNGNLILNGTASINYLNVVYETASVIYSSGSNQFGDDITDIQTLIGTIKLSGSLQLTGSANIPSITGSLFGTASNAITASYILNAVSSSFSTTASYAVSSSYAISSSYSLSSSFAVTASYIQNAQTASYVLNAISASFATTASYVQNAQSASYVLNAISSSYSEFAVTASAILGGSVNHIPLFITDINLATSSMYQSGSSTIVINQNNATTANPEALYVWQPNNTSINVISGKGNLDNYLQLNIQNTNQGANASSDVVATANNGSEVDNFIDMGINSENFAGFLGVANDSYLYTHAHNFWIGNINDGYKTYLFNSSSLLPIITLNSDTAEITGSLFGTASWAQNAIAALSSVSSSYSSNAELLDGKDSSIFATTGSNIFIGNQTVTGSLFTSGSNTLIGSTTLTGSLNISGSTTQIGNNSLLGNTFISGSLTISGAYPVGSNLSSFNVHANTVFEGYTKFLPVNANINTSISASYIYVSGSTNDLYFSQNGNGYTNTTRLRWLEGNLYTGLLNGGIITTQSSTVYQISSGSGIVVNLNASLNDNPYPTITYVNWTNLSSSIATLSASYDQQFVSVQSNGTIFAQGTPYTDGQYNTLIPIGIVIHQNRSTINATQTFPSVAYGWKQRSYDFVKAFGPLKISGYTLAASGSSTGSLTLSGGTSWVDGRNYTIDPNNPSYIVEANGITTSKIYRYYQSGSGFVYNTNGGAGYATIDPANYSNNGVLTPVGTNDWTIQRVFYFPNSATKAFYIYYGNATYSNQAAAQAAVNTEPFSEAPNTAANAIYVGYMLLRNNADFTTPASYTFYASGLFRGSGASVTSGGGGSTALVGLSDVLIASPTNGQPLVYNSSTLKWQNASTLTATLTGNASTATTASYAQTASYAVNSISSSYALTASYALNAGGTGAGFPYTGSATISGSLIVDGYISATSFTGSLFGTASWADNSISSSYALSSSYSTTASYAVAAQTLLGAVTSASYAATASVGTNFVVNNTLQIDGTLIDRSTILSTIVGTNNLYTQATGSYTSAFGKYTLHNGANARAGEFITVWNGTTVTYTDISTTDIGSTSDITFNSAIVSSDIQINAIAATSGWTVKMLTTYI